VDASRLRSGEVIAGISAILLFTFMFFHWFGVKLVNTSNLLFAIQSVEPGKNAWEALDYIPIFLLLAIIVPFAVAVLRLANAPPKALVLANALVAILGVVSVMLILYRIINPPVFYVETTITSEGAVQFPIFLALLSATGISFGGFLASREGSAFPPGLRAGRHRDQARIA
jgi:uncharacterized membrane protein